MFVKSLNENISKNYIIYKQDKKHLGLLIKHEKKIEYKKFLLNTNFYKFYYNENFFYILTSDNILLIKNLFKNIKNNNLIIYKFQEFSFKNTLKESSLIPIHNIIIHLTKKYIYIYINEKDNVYLLKKKKNNIDFEHVKYCKNKFITISFDIFSNLFLYWYRDLYISIKDGDDLLLLLLTFKNWLEQSFIYFYKKTNLSFFKILYIKNENIYILGKSCLYILNYMERFIDFKIDISYYLNRFNYDEIVMYGENNFCYFVIIKKTKYQIFLEYFVINNLTKSFLAIYNHEYWFSDYFQSQNDEKIQNIQLYNENDNHFINYNKGNRNYLHYLFSFKNKCIDTIFFKILQVKNLEQNYFKFRKNYNEILGSSVTSEDDKEDKIINKCCICYDNNAKILFLPCSHYCCCKSCSVNLTSCPICRKHILNKRSVFFH